MCYILCPVWWWLPSVLWWWKLILLQKSMCLTMSHWIFSKQRIWRRHIGLFTTQHNHWRWTLEDMKSNLLFDTRMPSKTLGKLLFSFVWTASMPERALLQFPKKNLYTFILDICSHLSVGQIPRSGTTEERDISQVDSY